MYTLEKNLKFAAAHKLNDSNSLTTKRCLNLHGHEWNVKVKIQSYRLVDDMIIDFGKLAEIIEGLDHQYLNDILWFNPTAENLSKFIHDRIQSELKDRLVNIDVTIEESPGAKITYSM